MFHTVPSKLLTFFLFPREYAANSFKKLRSLSSICKGIHTKNLLSPTLVENNGNRTKYILGNIQVFVCLIKHDLNNLLCLLTFSQFPMSNEQAGLCLLKYIFVFENLLSIGDMQEDWCGSIGSVEEIKAKALKRQEAAAKRERAMAYALTHQVISNYVVLLEICELRLC